MIWLTWRQFRAQSIVTAAFLAALAVALLVTGLRLAPRCIDSASSATCRQPLRHDARQLSSSEVRGFSDTTERLLYSWRPSSSCRARLIGLFWGAPLVTRELEAGTFRLAWNQSVPRSRWIAVKLGLLALAGDGRPGCSA